MNRAQYAYEYFVKQGWTPVQAAAIVGNLQQESGMGLNPDALNKNDAGPGNHSIGIGQWNRDRKDALVNFASKQGSSPLSFDTQLAFVQNELNGSESGVAQRLKQAQDVKSATAAFIGYERPQGWTPNNPMGGHGWTNRLNNALALAGGSYNGSSDDPSIAPQNYGFGAPHLPSLSKLPMAQTLINSLNEATGVAQADVPPSGINAVPTSAPPPAETGILAKIFGSFGKLPNPYWMKGPGWDDEAKKAYMAQNLQEGGWPSLRSFLG